jgi:hypothetical protein
MAGETRRIAVTEPRAQARPQSVGGDDGPRGA